MTRLFAGAEFVPGMLWASNLIPDTETGLGNWIDERILRAMREGMGHFEDDPQGKPLSPTMPDYVYGNMSLEDPAAIVAYLRSLPSIVNDVPGWDPS